MNDGLDAFTELSVTSATNKAILERVDRTVEKLGDAMEKMHARVDGIERRIWFIAALVGGGSGSIVDLARAAIGG